MCFSKLRLEIYLKFLTCLRHRNGHLLLALLLIFLRSDFDYPFELLMKVRKVIETACETYLSDIKTSFHQLLASKRYSDLCEILEVTLPCTRLEVTTKCSGRMIC